MPMNCPEPEEAEFIPTRQSLLSRLKDWNDHESWRDFFDTYWRLIYRMARRAGLSDAEGQDVVQETMLSVAKAMPGFKYDPALGSFKTWLNKLTHWRIADQFRKRRPAETHATRAPDDTRGTSALERVADPQGSALDGVWNDEWQRNLLDVALSRVKRQVDPKHYQMFDFYVLQQWPVKKVARTLQVSAGRVYLAKHRISALLNKEVRRLTARIT
jgi:RNA polymerase sigma factor (sigma-70 family)